MAEVSSCQGNWAWFTDQMFIFKDDADEMYTTHQIMNKIMMALDAASRSSKYTNASWCSFLDHSSEHCLDFQTILNQLVQYMTELEKHCARTFPSSILSCTDSIGIAVTMHGYIDSQTAGKPSFKNDIDEDKAVIDLAALLSQDRGIVP